MNEKLSKIIFISTIFVGSFLLFSVQPMLAKAILPLVGGSSFMWICSMVFFQTMLLVGYAYSAVGSACLNSKEQGILQLVFVVLCILIVIPIKLTIPLQINDSKPEFLVLMILFISIGMPYFILSANSTLIQRWYNINFNESPYFLFGVSNIASVLGLLSYPFAIEWLLTLKQQMTFWSAGFAVFSVLLCLTVFNIIISKNKPSTEVLGLNLPLKKSLHTTILGFIPSSLFLSTTLFISTDISPFPLIWVIPLALYLLSFIIVFSENAGRVIKVAQALHPTAIFLMIFVSLFYSLGTKDSSYHLIKFGILYASLFIISVSCHGRIANEKPDPQYLTSYYLFLSLGGSLGGILNIVAPYIFDSIVEYYLVIILSLYATYYFSERKGKKSFIKYLPFKSANINIMMFMTFLLYTYYLVNRTDDKILYQGRNFFGVSRIYKDEQSNAIYYLHGTTTHGLQRLEQKYKLDSYSYYAPISHLINNFPNQLFNKPFGFVGLGVGTLSCLGKKGQKVDYFEIDPQVIEIAQNEDWFTYVKDCPSEVNIIKGDGRLEIQKEPDNKYNVIVVDAFSSDSIPIHLITKEAVDIYKSKIDSKNGLLIFQISNKFLDLRGVLITIAEELGLKAYYIKHRAYRGDVYNFASDWIILVPIDTPWDYYLRGSSRHVSTKDFKGPLWTDDYSNILPVLNDLLPSNIFIRY